MPDQNGSDEHVPRKERDRLRLRGEILEAAAELFAQFTYEKTSVQQIAEKVEISVGRIYNLFEGKEAIFQELVQRIYDDIEADTRKAAADIDDPIERLRALFSLYISYCGEHKHAMITIHNENPMKMEGIIKRFIDQQTEFVTGIFEAAVEQGLIRREDPRTLTLVFFGIAHGLANEMATGVSDYPVEYYSALFERIFMRPLLDNRSIPGTEESR